MKPQIIKDNLYEVTYKIYFASREDMQKELFMHGLSDYKTDGYDGLHFHVSDNKQANIHIIWVNSSLTKERQLSTLLHELTHALITVWEVHGLNMVKDQEAYAYYFTYIFTQIKRRNK
jgi:Zn-dependent peptidase ImmA (M78 family)